MKTYIALLRGINVSGQKKINMKDLISHMEAIGLKEVKTYIQSGNLIFHSENNREDLVSLIENKIEEEYNFKVPVCIILNDELKDIIEDNPFAKNNIDHKYMYVTYLFYNPKNDLINKLEDYKYKDDEFLISEKQIYISCPGGYGRTKINNNFFESMLKIKATTRNWKTTLKLKELADKIND